MWQNAARNRIAGAMIGRAARVPLDFPTTKSYLATGMTGDPPDAAEKWRLILRHCPARRPGMGAEDGHSLNARPSHGYSKDFPAPNIAGEISTRLNLADVEALPKNT